MEPSTLNTKVKGKYGRRKAGDGVLFSDLLPDAFLAQELAAVPCETFIGYSRRSAKLWSLKRSQCKLHFRGWAMGSGATCKR